MYNNDRCSYYRYRTIILKSTKKKNERGDMIDVTKIKKKNVSYNSILRCLDKTLKS